MLAQPSPTLQLKVRETLSRDVRAFSPTEPGSVSVYTCGPTVYRDAHIGNLRSYLMADWLRRFLEAQGYTVNHIKNITDVGHMREDLLDRGEDKVIAAARASGQTPQDIAAHYTRRFLDDESRLGVLPATEYPRATDHVEDMIAIIRLLVSGGFAYEAEGNVYFEVSRFPDYGKLSGQQGGSLEQSGRVAADPLKRDQRDFALWKAAEAGRTLKWFSPWGWGFPGWHIECSAIGHAKLGAEIDFHTGGVDNIFPHHEDEIAQSEAAFGKPHVRMWLHGQHLLVDGLKMAKSTGNVYLVADLEQRGFDPMAFRYLCATAKYRTRLNFTLSSLRAAQRGLNRLRASLRMNDGEATDEQNDAAEGLRKSFWEAAANDLNIPSALAITWRVARSDLPGSLKRDLLTDFDRLLGLDLARVPARNKLPAEVIDLLRQCHVGRQAKDHIRADTLRAELIDLGYEVRQTPDSTVALPMPAWQREEPGITSSRDVASLLQQTPQLDYTVCIVARRGCRELERCIASAERWLPDGAGEVIVVDNGFEEQCQAFVGDLAADDERFRLFRVDHFIGSAAARNVALRQARGRFVILIDTSVEVVGDVFTPLAKLLDDPTVGIAGRWGVQTTDMRDFTESDGSGDVHAVEGYLMAFRRNVLREAGLLDEKFRFYRHLDLDFSFAVRSRGYRAIIDTTLPVVKHDHVDWNATPPEERDRLSKRNFYRFLRKWEKHPELLSAGR